MTKVYIHGANATPNSWNYIRNEIGDGILLSYDSANGFRNNLELMKQKLEKVHSFQFIAHSLGGIYAVHLANHFDGRVKGAVTLSTPYGGHDIPFLARYYMHWHRLLHDVIPTGWPVSTSLKYAIKWPWTNIVTTAGSVPWEPHPNDGVVTIQSQRYRKDMDLVELKCNHYEVMLSQPAVDIIKSKIT